jgi:hypothetical protein
MKKSPESLKSIKASVKPSYRYLVCYEAFYAGSSKKFDGIFSWDEQDIDDLKKKCREKLYAGPCAGYDGHASITLTNVTKLGVESL